MRLIISVIIFSTFFNLKAQNILEKPNIIFVLLDDLGKEWISCYGGENIETPRIDKLAAEGLMFENAYSMPQCTPSRVALITGQYPFRNGWVNHFDVPRWGVGYFDWDNNPSIAKTLKSAGYKTAVAGKWQINDFRLQPDAMVKHGFDEYCMWTGAESAKDKSHTFKSSKRYWNPYIHTKKGTMVYKDKFGPDVFNEFVLNFITENKENPFFIYYPMVLPHSPFVNTPLELGVKDKYSKHKAMVKYIDHLTGKLIDHLTNLGLRENTIVVWTSDNGTSTKINNTRHGKLVKGGKMQTTENGVNTPFIVSCPSLIPQGKTTDALVDFTDMHQTFADFAGVTPDQSYVYDGLSAKEVFLNTTKGTRTWVMAMGSEPGVFTHKGIENKFYFRDRVLRNERYKIFIDSNREVVKLIDLKNDPEEKLNLIDNPEYKSILQDLSEKIDVFPEYDQDPKYTVRKPNPWDRKATRPSKVHKKGYPNTAKSNRSQK